MKSSNMHHYTVRKILTYSLFILLGGSILFYAYYQSKAFLSGPIITLSSPQNGETFNQSLIKVEGSAENIARLEMNGKQIFIDTNGNFSEQLLLLDGYNIISVYATDKFQREVEKKIEVTLQEESLF